MAHQDDFNNIPHPMCNCACFRLAVLLRIRISGIRINLGKPGLVGLFPDVEMYLKIAAPLQEGIIDSISVPLILNHYFIFLMALMRVIRKFEVSKLFLILVQYLLYFLFYQ